MANSARGPCEDSTLLQFPVVGGLEMQIPLLAAALRDRRHELTILCPAGSAIARAMTGAGFPVHPLSGDKRNLCSNILTIARLLRDGEYDVLHAHGNEDLRVISPALALAGRGTPFMITRHMGVKHVRRDVLHQWLYRKVCRLCAVSNYVAEGVRIALPIRSDRITVLPPGIDRARFQPHPDHKLPAQQVLGLDGSQPVVGMLGRVTPMKGHAEFLEAACRLRDARREVQWVVAGGCGAGHADQVYYHAIQDLVKRRPGADRVHFIGFAAQSAAVLQAFDIFVFPSHLEAFGLSLVEAMAMGLPVVACAAGGVLDIVADGDTGLLVPPRDPTALAVAIGRLLDDPGLRQRLGQAAREASARWDIARIAERYEIEYTRCAASDPVSS